MSHPAPVSFWKRPLARLAAIGFASLFIMAPTPGNVGGCSGGGGSTPVAAGSQPSQTPEYMYFDRGMCSGFCWRLYECGVLCQALNPAHPTYPSDCDHQPELAFAQCVRAEFVRGPDGSMIQPLNTQFFGLGQCPHQCPSGQFQTAYEWDVQACSDAIQTRSCSSSGGGSIGTTFMEGVSECTNICQ